MSAGEFSGKVLIRLKKIPAVLTPKGEKFITINQGDSIHHPQHGIGRVQSIDKRSFGGEEATTFAQLYFKREGLTLMLRKKDLDKTVRNPIGAQEAKELLEHLETCKVSMSKQWKARANANQAAMERGDPFGYVEIYKGLRQLEEEGTLRASDRTHLHQSLDFLTEEVANALGKTPDQARKLITRGGRKSAAIAA